MQRNGVGMGAVLAKRAWRTVGPSARGLSAASSGSKGDGLNKYSKRLTQELSQVVRVHAACDTDE